MDETALLKEDRFRWKAAEARDRLARLASGESGAWPWPELTLLHSPSPDDEWLLELDLARD